MSAELATARRYGARLVILLFNNGQFGSVRVHQERRYPGRSIGMDLTNPDFVMLAQSFGAHAETAFIEPRSSGRRGRVPLRAALRR